MRKRTLSREDRDNLVSDSVKIMQYLTGNNPHEKRTSTYMYYKAWHDGKQLELSPNSSAGINAVLYTLETNGYVEVDPSPFRGNSRPYTLTEAGKTLLASEALQQTLGELFEQGLVYKAPSHPQMFAGRNQLRRHVAILHALEEVQNEFGDPAATRNLSQDEVDARVRRGVIDRMRARDFRGFTEERLLTDMRDLAREGYMQTIPYQQEAGMGVAHCLRTITESGREYMATVEQGLRSRGIEIESAGRHS